MTAPQIDGEAALERAFAAPAFLVFKHSPICPASASAFARYEAFLAERDDVPTAWLDVLGQRPLSREVERRTGVRHESPQAILLRDGRPAWDASHGAITTESLAAAVSGLQSGA